jgi:hypothetical protein
MQRGRRAGASRFKPGISAVAAMLLISATLLLPASASSSRAGASCGAPAGRTLASTPQVRAYALSGPAPTQVVDACLKPSGPSRRLGPVRPKGKVSTSSMPGPFGLAAPWAAGYEIRTTGQDGFLVFASARNLRTQRWHRCFVSGADRPLSPPPKLLLSQGGDMAWATAVAGSSDKEVGVCDGASRRIVARSVSIEMGSLTLRGSTLSWAESGATHSVEMS